jgi:hypothetical protein
VFTGVLFVVFIFHCVQEFVLLGEAEGELAGWWGPDVTQVVQKSCTQKTRANHGCRGIPFDVPVSAFHVRAQLLLQLVCMVVTLPGQEQLQKMAEKSKQTDMVTQVRLIATRTPLSRVHMAPFNADYIPPMSFLRQFVVRLDVPYQYLTPYIRAGADTQD